MKALLLFFCTATLTAATATSPTPDVERLFKVKCGSCHGMDGSGGVGPSLRGKLAHNSSKALFDVIKNGLPGTAMPPTALADPQITKLVSYIRYLQKDKK